MLMKSSAVWMDVKYAYHTIPYHTNRPEFDRVMIVCNEIEDHGMALRRSRFLPLETIPEDSPIKHTDML